MARSLQTAVDSTDFFVESRDITTALLNISATATGSNNSADQVNTLHKGVALFINITSIAATATIGINVQGKDPVSGNYVTLTRISLDAQATLAATSTSMFEVYPGLTTSVPATVGTNGALNLALPKTWRVQASITATASQGGANVGYSISQSRIL